ncbi:hypothetical protein M8494_23885 [Serratia ureilytica]
MHGTYEANKTMHHADVIFAVGVRFDDRTTNNLAKYCPDATVLHIDIDPTSISKTVDADIPIVGDAKQVLVQMLELLAQDEKAQDHDAARLVAVYRAVACPRLPGLRQAQRHHQTSGGDRNLAPPDQRRCVCHLGRRPAPDVRRTLLSVR